MARRFVLEAGDIVWLEFSPQAKRKQTSHEQAGHRPALVLSPSAYNSKTGTMLCCPMTTQIKGYPFRGHHSCGRRQRRGTVRPSQKPGLARPQSYAKRESVG